MTWSNDVGWGSSPSCAVSDTCRHAILCAVSCRLMHVVLGFMLTLSFTCATPLPAASSMARRDVRTGLRSRRVRRETAICELSTDRAANGPGAYRTPGIPKPRDGAPVLPSYSRYRRPPPLLGTDIR